MKAPYSVPGSLTKSWGLCLVLSFDERTSFHVECNGHESNKECIAVLRSQSLRVERITLYERVPERIVQRA